MSIDLGLPAVRHAGQYGVGVGPNGIEFSAHGHYFKTTMTDAQLARSASVIDRPLSIIYQVTRDHVVAVPTNATRVISWHPSSSAKSRLSTSDWKVRVTQPTVCVATTTR
jgi:hypothetical protein